MRTKRLWRAIVLVVLVAALLLPVTPARTAGAQSTGTTTRVSVASNGTQSNGAAGCPSISADGRFVAFSSFASNLVEGDTNGYQDVFVHNRQTGATTRVSVASNGVQGNDDPSCPLISADGRYVAFASGASNLVNNDTNGTYDIFVHDRQTGATTRVSVASNGAQSDDHSFQPSISADGRFVAFSSDATNLVGEDTDGWSDIFVHDRVTGATTLVSVASDGTKGYGGSYSPSISADGRYLTFQSFASNLVSDDTNGWGSYDIFVHDRQTGATTRVSVASNGTQVYGDSSYPSISADGRYVAFESYASNLVEGDTDGWSDIFVHDRVTGATTLVSVASDGTKGYGSSNSPSISADGRYVAFESYASNLVIGDTNGYQEVFVHDKQTGETTRVSVAVNGTQGNLDIFAPSVSADGRFVAFSSFASNLVEGDTNGYQDVFVRDRGGAPSGYSIAGRVTNVSGNPLSGVTIAAGGDLLSTTTAANGRYTLIASAVGKYTLTPILAGYTFTPSSLIVTVNQNRANQNFVGQTVACGDPVTAAAPTCLLPAAQPFLSLPVRYTGDIGTFLLDSDISGGHINSWFDHDKPIYGGNQNVTLYDGSVFTTRTLLANPRLNLWCYNGRCYDGHDGMDISKRLPSLAILPAASGVVLETCHRDGRVGELCKRAGALGKYIVISHRNNTYATLYAHLASIEDGVTVGMPVTRNDISSPLPIGVMGNSGDPTGKMGVHLHFQVFFNRYNADPWIPSSAEVVDPMGWQPADGRSDPWQSAPSVPLFKNAGPLSCSPGSTGDTLSTGTVSAQIPADAVPEGTSVTLSPNSILIDAANTLRNLGRSFYLRIFDPGSMQAQAQAANKGFGQPVNLTIAYPEEDNPHFDLVQMGLYWQNPGTQDWLTVPATRNDTDRIFSAQVTDVGDYALLAPLVCPADITEPMDDLPSWKTVQTGLGLDVTLNRLFDIPGDEDWIAFEATAGLTYILRTQNLASGVDTVLTLYANDEETVLAADDDGGGGNASHILWTPDASGLYYLRVSPGAGSQSGCDSTYQLTLGNDALETYLPILAPHYVP